MCQTLNAVPRLTIYNKIFQYIPANFIQVAHAKTSFINTKSLIEIALNSLNFEQYNIIVHYLVLHSSDQCQPLDIGLFDPMKRYDVNYQSKLGISAQSNQILKTYFFLLCMCNELNCHSSFRSIGIIPKSVTSTRPTIEITRFDILKIIKSGHMICHMQMQLHFKISNHSPFTSTVLHQKNKF